MFEADMRLLCADVHQYADDLSIDIWLIDWLITHVSKKSSSRSTPSVLIPAIFGGIYPLPIPNPPQKNTQKIKNASNPPPPPNPPENTVQNSHCSDCTAVDAINDIRRRWSIFDRRGDLVQGWFVYILRADTWYVYHHLLHVMRVFRVPSKWKICTAHVCGWLRCKLNSQCCFRTGPMSCSWNHKRVCEGKKRDPSEDACCFIYGR